MGLIIMCPIMIIMRFHFIIIIRFIIIMILKSMVNMIIMIMIIIMIIKCADLILYTFREYCYSLRVYRIKSAHFNCNHIYNASDHDESNHLDPTNQNHYHAHDGPDYDDHNYHYNSQNHYISLSK